MNYEIVKASPPVGKSTKHYRYRNPLEAQFKSLVFPQDYVIIDNHYRIDEVREHLNRFCRHTCDYDQTMAMQMRNCFMVSPCKKEHDGRMVRTSEYCTVFLISPLPTNVKGSTYEL